MSIRTQIANERIEQYQKELSKCSENQTEEIQRLQSCIEYNRKVIQNPACAAAQAWTVTTNVVTTILKPLAETDPIQVVSICDRIEKFLIEEGIISEEDIRRLL